LLCVERHVALKSFWVLAKRPAVSGAKDSKNRNKWVLLCK